ncbi:hypothetical protein DFJ77DRAFT_324467 [Powellomyces hirtus]|nr:hypothetical protein DFJ77DRAFT_324467 [Powellomyces hirtus]
MLQWLPALENTKRQFSVQFHTRGKDGCNTKLRKRANPFLDKRTEDSCRNRISTYHSLKNGPNNETKTVVDSHGSVLRFGNVARLVSGQGWERHELMSEKPSKNAKSNNSVNTCPNEARVRYSYSPEPALRWSNAAGDLCQVGKAKCTQRFTPKAEGSYCQRRRGEGTSYAHNCHNLSTAHTP